MVMTNNPGNPPIRDWIQQEIIILHRDPKLRKIFPKIDVITRQNRNIKQRIMQNKFQETINQKNR